jgi:CheY-like chemotaxis protein
MQSLAGTSVLVVDDDAETLTLFVQTLERLGADVNGATDAGAALSILSVWRPDVMLCDLHLPEVDGYALLGKIREREELNGVPVIAISGSHPALEGERCRAEGFADHLTKPARLAAIVSAIQRQLA